MSEYQYYEFQTLDRPLNEAEMKEISRLSSRVNLTSHSAAFVYHYGDFPAQPEKVLVKYFDALLYTANWGTRQLMFKFPENLVNIKAMRQYEIEDVITVEKTGSFVTLNIFINDEKAEWIETGEGWLSGLALLRNMIMQGDYRTLYLAWLRACDLASGAWGDEEDDKEEVADVEFETDYPGDFYLLSSNPEPPVPPNLKKLDGPLQQLLEFFEVDPVWLEVAARNSPSARAVVEPLEQWITRLPEAECRRLLLQAAQNERNAAQLIRAELRKRYGATVETAPAGPPRRALDLFKAVQLHRLKAAEEKKAQAAQARIKRLEIIAQQEPQLWQKALNAVAQRNTRGYDAAVEVLKDLAELAAYRGQTADFKDKVARLQQQFSSLTAFKSRLRAARLI